MAHALRERPLALEVLHGLSGALQAQGKMRTAAGVHELGHVLGLWPTPLHRPARLTAGRLLS